MPIINPTWIVSLELSVRGVGNFEDKPVEFEVDAPTIQAAIDSATRGIVTVRVLGASLKNVDSKADIPTIDPEPVQKGSDGGKIPNIGN